MTIPLWFILYAALAFAVYFPCLKGTVVYDDRWTVDSPAPWLGSAWTVRRAMSRWLSWLAILGLRRWPGTWRGFHSWNVWLHIAGACLVREMTGSTLAGALFLVHPWAVNAVGSMAQGAALLSAVLGVAGFREVLAGHDWRALALLGLACMAKEDGVGFLVPYALIQPWFWVAGMVMAPIGLKLRKWYLPETRTDEGRVYPNSGDFAMRIEGLPESYGWEDHIWTVSISTAILYALWALGLNQSPYHGSAFPKPSLGNRIVGVVILGVTMVSLFGFPALHTPLVLIVAGPWLCYLAIRTHEQIAEYRNYSSLFGLVWLVSMIPGFNWFAAPLILFFGYQTYWKSFAWSNAEAMWTIVTQLAEGDRSRAYQELGALAMSGVDGHQDLNLACTYFRKALELNPNFAAPRKNLAWTLLILGKKNEGIHEMEEVTRRNPLYHFAWEELGDIYKGEGRPMEALSVYRQAIAVAGPGRCQRAVAGLRAMGVPC